MPSPNYHYQCVDLSGRLHDTRWFYAEHDADARSFVEAKHPGCRCVIWQERRIVGKLGFDQHSDVISRSRDMAARSFSLLRETAEMLPDGSSSLSAK